jgi:hypothetical protein
LRQVVAHAHIDFTDDATKAVEVIEQHLREYFGHQTAFVPFWGIHLDDGVVLDFGAFRLIKLGESGLDREILTPFLEFRSGVGEEQLSRDLAMVRKDYEHVPNVPILPIDYDGAAEGADEFVAPIAERIAEALQFLAAWVINGRSYVRIIDHRGAYFGRFMTIMPVLTRDTNRMAPWRLDSPNVRGYPYGPTISADAVAYFKDAGFLELLPSVPSGPSRGDSISSILLRAIQLFSDGERAVSYRQAMIAYVGACDALFGKKDAADLYTCAGMAAASEQDFETAFREAEVLYEARSEAAHRGITPDSIGSARRYAMISIRYVVKHKAQLTNKREIRKWIAPHVARAEGFKKSSSTAGASWPASE